MDNYDQVIPKTPTTPPAFIQTIPVEKFICDRKFLYQGRILSCDSNLDADAERLRSIVQTTPAALKELDTYQKNRKEAVIHAYIGSVGLLTILTTFIISREMTDGNGNPTKEGTIIRNIGSLSGIAIAGGSFFLGLRALSQNEKHLGQAVKNFNDAHSDQPIELQFSTGVSF